MEEKFIKEYWFKIIIAVAILVAALSVGYYFVIFIPKYQISNTNLSNQEKCAEDSKTFSDKYKQVNSLGSETFVGYYNHYNKSLDKCFISLGTLAATSDGFYTTSELDDAVEGTTYASISTGSHNSKPDDLSCILFPNGNNLSKEKSCKSQTEFDTFVKPFMEN